MSAQEHDIFFSFGMLSLCHTVVACHLHVILCSARKGSTLSPSIQKHMEEAMQPDGEDLEYIYLGPSRSTVPVAPERSPMFIAAFCPPAAPNFIQEDTSPYAAVNDWSAAPHAVSPLGNGRRMNRSSDSSFARGARPKTAGQLPPSHIPCHSLPADLQHDLLFSHS
jgi:hypothetical protein